MRPPTNGMQASAAAILEGNPVDCVVSPRGGGSGGGFGFGGIGTGAGVGESGATAVGGLRAICIGLLLASGTIGVDSFTCMALASVIVALVKLLSLSTSFSR